MLFPLVYFYIFEFKWWVNRHNPLIPILLTAVFLIGLCFLTITTFSDPGLLPRRLFPGDASPHKIKIKVVLNGIVTGFKICDTCFIVKPPRSSHCHDCDNCVERFDHHCPWIGQCVAKRNYRFFFLFLLFTNVFSIFMAVLCIVKLREYFNSYRDTSSHGSSKALSETIVSLFLLIYCLIKMMFITSLFSYHVYLVLSNTTTKESLKSFFDNVYGNVFSRSCATNVKEILLCPRLSQPSLLNSMDHPAERISSKDKIDTPMFNKVIIPEEHKDFYSNDSSTPSIKKHEILNAFSPVYRENIPIEEMSSDRLYFKNSNRNGLDYSEG